VLLLIGFRVSDVRQVCVRFHSAIELIGARWTGAILRAMLTGARRFAEIKTAVPELNDTMLTRRLRELTDAGIVERHVLSTSPVHVEYTLTEKGLELEPVVDVLRTWAHKWIPLADDTGENDSVGEGSSQEKEIAWN
jgi:DNA-binding HxlR family transcriptional regulator